MMERCTPSVSIAERTPMLPGIDENPVMLIIRERSAGPQPNISIRKVSVVCQIAPGHAEYVCIVVSS